MTREELELLILGNIFYYAGLFMNNLFLLVAGFSTLVWCLIICIYDYIRMKKIEKKLKQMQKDWDESLERLREKLGSDDK